MVLKICRRKGFTRKSLRRRIFFAGFAGEQDFLKENPAKDTAERGAGFAGTGNLQAADWLPICSTYHLADLENKVNS